MGHISKTGLTDAQYQNILKIEESNQQFFSSQTTPTPTPTPTPTTTSTPTLAPQISSTGLTPEQLAATQQIQQSNQQFFANTSTGSDSYEAQKAKGIVTPLDANGFVIPPPSTSPVTTLSSTAGETVLNENIASLQKIESSYSGPSIMDFLSSIGQDASFQNRETLAKQAGIDNYTGDETQNTALLNLLRSGQPISGPLSKNPSSNPALSSMEKDADSIITSGGMTKEQEDAAKELSATKDKILSDAAAARAALDAGDLGEMDFLLQSIQVQNATYQKQLTDFFNNTKSYRDLIAKSLTPSAKEQELGSQLATLKNEITNFKIQTEEDKFREFEGQTLGFAGGRASEIDIRAQFKLQFLAAEYSNVLDELGLAQDLREGQGETAEALLSFAQNDFELQQKIQDRLFANEDRIFDKIEKLNDEAKESLADFIDALAGTNPDTMTAESRSQLDALIAATGQPIGALVDEVLKTQYQMRIFDEAIARDRASKSGDFFTDTQIADGALKAGLTISEFRKLSNDEQNAFIRGDKVSERWLLAQISGMLAGAASQDLGLNDKDDDGITPRDTIREIIALSGFDPDTFDNGAYADKGGFFDRVKTLLGQDDPLSVPTKRTADCFLQSSECSDTVHL